MYSKDRAGNKLDFPTSKVEHPNSKLKIRRERTVVSEEFGNLWSSRGQHQETRKGKM